MHKENHVGPHQQRCTSSRGWLGITGVSGCPSGPKGVTTPGLSTGAVGIKAKFSRAGS